MTDASVAALIRDLRDLGAEVSDTSEPDAQLAAELARIAKQRARKVTGFMAGSITAGGSFVDVFAIYAPIVHDHGNPFITQAETEVDPEPIYQAFLERELEENLRRNY